MGAIIIEAVTIPQVSLLTQAGVEQRDALELQAHEASTAVIDAANYEQLDALWKEVDGFTKQVEKTRKLLKEPSLAYGNAIDATAKATVENLLPLREKIGVALAKYRTAENLRREEAARKAREEALRIEREQIAAAEAARLAEEQRLREQAELDAPPGEEPAPIEMPIFTKPEVQRVPVAFTPPPLKGSVKLRPKPVLVIDDINLIPVMHGRIRLLVPDEAAILDLVKREIDVPGCRVIYDDSIQKNGARS